MKSRSEQEEQITVQAMAWSRALASDAADWDGFVAWLEADPAHGRIFDEVALVERMVDAHRARLARGEQAMAEPAPRRREVPRRRILAAMAAAAALALALPTALRRPDAQSFETGRFQILHVRTEDGIAVDLAPASRLRLNGSGRMVLERGEAFFTVAHRPGRALAIRAGAFTIHDIGTRFALNNSESGLSVAVEEGSLQVQRDGLQAISLQAGERLVSEAGRKGVSVAPVAAGDIASWRAGRLVYDNAPLGVVIADISRYSGTRIRVDPLVRDRRFSGVLVIGDGSALLADLAHIMALTWRTEGDHILVGTAPR